MKPLGALHIESGVSIPPKNTGRAKRPHGPIRIAFEAMQIGDSVFIPRHAQNVTPTARNVFGKGKYTSRKQGTGVRVWRLA